FVIGSNEDTTVHEHRARIRTRSAHLNPLDVLFLSLSNIPFHGNVFFDSIDGITARASEKSRPRMRRACFSWPLCFHPRIRSDENQDRRAYGKQSNSSEPIEFAILEHIQFPSSSAELGASSALFSVLVWGHLDVGVENLGSLRTFQNARCQGVQGRAAFLVSNRVFERNRPPGWFGLIGLPHLALYRRLF